MGRPKQELTPEQAQQKLEHKRELAKKRQQTFYNNKKEVVLKRQQDARKELKELADKAAPPPLPQPQPKPKPQRQPQPQPQPKQHPLQRANPQGRRPPVEKLNANHPDIDLSKDMVVNAMKTTALIKTEGNRKVNVDKIKQVFKMINDNNLYDYIRKASKIADVIDTAKQVKDPTKTYSNNTKVALINSVIKTCEIFELKESKGVDFEGLYYYYKFFKLKGEIETNPVNTRVGDAVVSYDEFVKKIKDKFGLISAEYLLAKLYQECPLRNNYSQIKIVETEKECGVDSNCIEIPESANGVARVHLNVYKTKSRYGSKIITLSLYTTRLLKLYVVGKKIEGVLFPFDVSKRLKKMTEAVGVGGSVNMIRHSVASTLYWKKDSMDKNEFAHAVMKQTYTMGHEVKTWFGYIRGLKK